MQALTLGFTKKIAQPAIIKIDIQDYYCLLSKVYLSKSPSVLRFSFNQFVKELSASSLTQNIVLSSEKTIFCLTCPLTTGASRDRTDDPLLAKQVLSQLSYGPALSWAWVDLNHRPHAYQACALTN